MISGMSGAKFRIPEIDSCSILDMSEYYSLNSTNQPKSLARW